MRFLDLLASPALLITNVTHTVWVPQQTLFITYRTDCSDSKTKPPTFFFRFGGRIEEEGVESEIKSRVATINRKSIEIQTLETSRKAKTQKKLSIKEAPLNANV